MAFNHVVFPEAISYGSRGGPGFNTSVVEGDSGDSERVARWPNERRRYNARLGIRSRDDIYTVLEFYIANGGIVNGFLWRDAFDYSTGGFGRGVPAEDDELLGTGDGTNPAFQLIKTYEFGSLSKVRTIRKPIASTVVAQVDGTPTTAFSVDATTGIITFDTAPGIGLTVEAGCEFYVPVQFGAEIDQALQFSIDNYDVASIGDIPLIEMVGDVVTPARHFKGGGRIFGYNGGTIVLDWSYGSAIGLAGSVATTILMPDNAFLEGGGPYHHLSNSGSATLTFRTFDGQTVLWTMLAGDNLMTAVFVTGAGNVWRAF